MPQGSKILIVEDEMLISMEIKQKLMEMGYNVVGQAITGESAIQKAGEKKPDLILMDIRLKGELDGITAAKRVMELYDIPIIFLTAHSDKATLERAIAVSPSGYLLKPFKGRELMTNIEMSLHKHRIKQKVREEVHPEALSVLGKKIDAIMLPVAVISDTGVIKEINQIAADLGGFLRQELLGRPVNAIFEIQQEGNEPVLVDESGIKIILPDQVSLKRKDGTMVPVTLTGGFIFYDRDHPPEYLVLIEGAEITTTSTHIGPEMIRHLMAITEILKFPAFVIDKSLMLTGHNQLFAELANKAGISQYMLNRPLYETPKFSFFGDMQDLQEIFRSGDLERRIRKYVFGKTVKFIEFTRIPLKKEGVTTHIATIMADVTAERHAVYEAEKIRKEYTELYLTLENIRGLSADLRTSIHDLLTKIFEDEPLESGYAQEKIDEVSDIMSQIDTAWILYAEIRDQMAKKEYIV
ncbi:response regulator [Methanospirillum sp.]|uniref:response regulator n=1 Tax=Methanospirillum sp. TaxID=45200 RepID=UPI0035A02FFC